MHLVVLHVRESPEQAVPQAARLITALVPPRCQGEHLGSADGSAAALPAHLQALHANCNVLLQPVPGCPLPPHTSPRSPTELGPFTNLRINFTELPHIARQGYHSPSTFYAVTEMQVMGSCFCHGHADRCAPSGDLHAAVSIGQEQKA